MLPKNPNASCAISPTTNRPKVRPRVTQVREPHHALRRCHVDELAGRASRHFDPAAVEPADAAFAACSGLQDARAQHVVTRLAHFLARIRSRSRSSSALACTQAQHGQCAAQQAHAATAAMAAIPQTQNNTRTATRTVCATSGRVGGSTDTTS